MIRYGYARTYLDDQVIVCLNKGQNAATVDLSYSLTYLNGFIGSGKQDGQNQQQQNQQQGESTKGNVYLGNTCR